LRKLVRINDADGLLLTQLLYHIVTHIITHSIRIPDRTPKQALHPVGIGFPGLFGNLPAIFALDATHQPFQISQGSPVRFRSGKSARYAGMQFDQLIGPTCYVCWGRFLPTECGMLR